MSSRETETLDLRHVGEVAAVVARNATAVLAAPDCLSNPALSNYWQASHKRADLWQFSLDDALEASRRDQPLGKHAVRSASTVIGEVLSTELVTRLWTAVLVGHEQRHQTHHESLARRVYNDHLTARRSSLRLLTHPIALPSSQIVALDRIRQRAERWTDCLLATLPPECAGNEFAFDVDRFNEFAEDSEIVTRLSNRFSGWHLLALSLRVANENGPASDRTRNLLHREVLDSIASVIEATKTETTAPLVTRLDASHGEPAATDADVEAVLAENFGADLLDDVPPAVVDERSPVAEDSKHDEPARDVEQSEPKPVATPTAVIADRLPQPEAGDTSEAAEREPHVTVTPSGLQFRTMFPRRR